MNEQILAALSSFGLPALFTVVAVAAIGIPLPVTLLLIVAGSLAAQGAMNIWWAMAVASAGSVMGDQIGYAVGRWGGKALIGSFQRVLGGDKAGDPERLKKIDAKTGRWGAAGIFFSRWLITPLGPWVNLASGARDYSWLRFTTWDIAGEVFGSALYIWLGMVFSDRVQALSSILGDAGWTILGLLAAAFFGWKLCFQR